MISSFVSEITHTSFRVAYSIAKHEKPSIDGELIKYCIIAVAKEMCKEKDNLFKNIGFSVNTDSMMR